MEDTKLLHIEKKFYIGEYHVPKSIFTNKDFNYNIVNRKEMLKKLWDRYLNTNINITNVLTELLLCEDKYIFRKKKTLEFIFSNDTHFKNICFQALNLVPNKKTMSCENYCLNVLLEVNGEVDIIKQDILGEIIYRYPAEYLYGFYKACNMFYTKKYKKNIPNAIVKF